MAGINQGDIVQVTLRGDLYGYMTLGQQHYYCTGASVSADYVTAIQNVADSMRVGPINSWVGPYIAAAPNNWTSVEIRAQVVYPTRKIFAVSADGRPGALGSGATTGNLCGVITKRTVLGTRRGIGRLHTAPLIAISQTDGKVTAAFQTLMTNIGNYLIQTLTMPVQNTVLAPVLWSPSQPAARLDLISFTVQDTIRTLRRRTLRVGK